MHRIIIYGWMLLLVLTGCIKKQHYPKSVDIEDVEYSASGTVAGETFTFAAGKDNIYLYTSYQADSNNVKTFTGRYAPTNCNNCGKSLEISINDFMQGGALHSLSKDSLVRKYPFKTDNQAYFYYVGLTPIFNKSASSIQWQVNNQPIISQSPKFYQKVTNNQPVNVCLTAQSNGGCYSSNCQTILLGNRDVNTYVTATSDTTNVYFQSVVIGGKKPFTYMWDFGDGTTSTQTSPTHHYQYPGGYGVSLTVRDSTGKTASTHYNTVAGRDQSSCASNIVFDITKMVETHLGQITIVWTDENGVRYTSVGTQPASSYFEVISVADGEINENNQPTYKLKANINCVLYSGTTQKGLVAEVVFAIAY